MAAGGNERKPGIPVAWDTANSAVPRDAATTVTVASQIGIDRHRSIATPMAIPTPTAANFQGMPGDGAGYVMSWFTQNLKTGDSVVPGGHS